MKINIRIHLVLILVVLIAQNCNTTEPPPTKEEPPKNISLKLLDVSCTEAFIKVTANDTILPINITLNKNEQLFNSFTLAKTDTIIADTVLQPNITYVYQTAAEIDEKEEKSDTLQVKTLNITSDNYDWQTYTFGNPNYGSSTLYDVAIINKNDIWAVGEIYTDTSDAYNAVHWNGNEWELKRISVMYHDNLITTPLEGIFTFSNNDIWVTNGFPIHGNGNTWEMYQLQDMGLSVSISKVWGENSNDMYFVGRSGSIVHYKNGEWSKIESGTNMNIHNIWEDTNPFTGISEIICTASIGLDQPGPRTEVFRIKNDLSTEKLDKTGLGNYYGGIWFRAGIKYYIVGDGLYEKTYKDETKWINLNENKSITSNYLTCINGTGLNNIFAAGENGEVVHYNGLGWKSLIESTYLESGIYRRILVKENMVVVVGYNGSKAVILLGKN